MEERTEGAEEHMEQGREGGQGGIAGRTELGEVVG